VFNSISEKLLDGDVPVNHQTKITNLSDVDGEMQEVDESNLGNQSGKAKMHTLKSFRAVDYY
jgi:hypothetical protein